MTDWHLFHTSVTEFIVRELDGKKPRKIVSGGASGADAFARRYAGIHGIEIEELKPDWKKYGKAAGPMRNGDIVGRDTTHLIAFPHKDGRGTQDAVRKARSRGIKVCVVELSAGCAGGQLDQTLIQSKE